MLEAGGASRSLFAATPVSCLSRLTERHVFFGEQRGDFRFWTDGHKDWDSQALWQRPLQQAPRPPSHDVELGAVRDLPVPGRVLQQHAQPAEGGGRVSAVHPADRGAAVPLLPAGRHLPLQQLSLRLHFLRGLLHPRGLPAHPDQPPEQGRFPGHLPGARLRRLPVRPHRAAPCRHQLHWLRGPAPPPAPPRPWAR